MPTGSSKKPRPFIGIHFKCCNVYTRVYMNKSSDAYAGLCPKCGKKAVIKIGRGGSKSRFWTVE